MDVVNIYIYISISKLRPALLVSSLPPHTTSYEAGSFFTSPLDPLMMWSASRDLLPFDIASIAAKAEVGHWNSAGIVAGPVGKSLLESSHSQLPTA